MLSRIMIGSALIIFFQSCASRKDLISIVNYDDQEFYEVINGDKHYSCMSDYYLEEVIQAKIKVHNP